MTRPPGHSITLEEFRADIQTGLSRAGQKELYSKYLYDDMGSALFEAITLLPEYGLTRADIRLLQAHADTIAMEVEFPSIVVELGSGSGVKARWIIDAIRQRAPIRYFPVDLSPAALERCRRDLSEFDRVAVIPLENSYVEGLRDAVRARRPRESVLVLFLGSSIGNFEPEVAVDFLTEVRQTLREGDVLLLSADLVKDRGRMLAAYDDCLGLTAAFNLNLLARINRELEADFVLSQFEHEARYNEHHSRIEMHLRSKTDQRVHIGKDFTVDLRAGETIWTESSYKFRAEDFSWIAERSGFYCERQWLDEEWPFVQSVLRAT